MERYLIFDTETTGLPNNYKASFMDVDNWPRLTQLAFVVMDETGKIHSRFNCLIKPDGWTIPKTKFFTDNGMSTERNEKEGVPVGKAIFHFLRASAECDLFVSHNLAFDTPILRAEMFRKGVELSNKIPGYCTMKGTTKLVKAKTHAGRGKYPRLIELHRHLFGKGFEGQHDAFADVMATANCFIELKRRGLVRIKPKTQLNIDFTNIKRKNDIDYGKENRCSKMETEQFD